MAVCKNNILRCNIINIVCLVDSVKDVYSIQHLKKLLSEGVNDQIPEYGVTFAVLTSFDVDTEEKYFVITRW